ncbi:histidine kinase dimerization/phosphoacceptor domain -containing protein [Mucilaginibacter terrae]|uniref:histidine kinase n=1 Tax=Mucilaginibacter terrae TaxID=1955052 RepID=A0ABU3GQF5_9SPHI|nr:histidine kinase dimerization/phosphoacceptor domain -containing protein [Mucilaginibacter terrae]MDT3402013.1 two-component sensor histidine kinase [Mucilaginibacter terrae]
MKIIYQLIFLVLISTPVSAQRNNPNDGPESGLWEKLSSSKEGPEMIRVQLALGRAILYRSGDKAETIDSAMNFGVMAERESRKINFTEGVINAMVLRSVCFSQKRKPAMGFKLAQVALAFSKKVKNKNGIAEAYMAIAECYPVHIPDSLRLKTYYYSNATAIFRQENNMQRLAAALEIDAEMCFLANKKTEAIKLLFEALNVNKVLGNKAVHGIYWMIARTSNGLGDYPDAVKYSLLAIKTAEAVGDSTLKLCSIYHNLATVYMNMTNYRQALPYSLKALKIARRYNDPDYITTVAYALAIQHTRLNKFPKALPLLAEMEKYYPEGYGKMLVTGCYLNNLTWAKQYKKAAIYAQKLIKDLAELSPDSYNELVVYYGILANYYLDTRQIDMAYHYADLQAAIPAVNRTPLNNRARERVYYSLDSIRGDFRSAFKHYQQVQKIIDSGLNVTKAYQISLLNIENDTEKRNDKIEALNKQALVKDNLLKRNQLIQKVVIVGCIMLAIITALVYSQYRLKQRSNALLLEQRSEINHQNMELQHLVNEKNHLIGDKDELLLEKDVLLNDKDLLIKEVNHRVKNNLQIVMNLLQSQSAYMANDSAQQAIIEGQNRVRSIALIHDQLFKTDNVTEIDLKCYIAEMVNSLDYAINMQGNSVKVRLNIDSIMLDVSQAIPVGIILNEAVTNAFKYAFPDGLTGEITITVKKIAQQIKICISDNGVGLPVNFVLEKANSLGMTLIRGLAGQLHGTFNIIDDDGVTISIEFPVLLSDLAMVTAIAETNHC